MEMLQLNDLHKTFNPGTVNEKVALNGVSLHMEAGDFATIVGSNGAGKSTLFNAITGGFIADEGSILLGGQDITFAPEHQRSKVIGHLFQDPLKGTAPNMTIEENLALAYLRAGTAPHAIFSRISRKDKEVFREKLALLDMGLEDRMKQPVGLLSGGQRQAVALLHTAFRSNSFMGTMTTGAHNVLLEYWLNVGLFGLASYFIALLASFRQMRKLERQNYIFCAAYMLWFMVMGWTERSMSTYEYQMVFLFLAMGVGSNKPRPVSRRRARLEKEAT